MNWSLHDAISVQTWIQNYEHEKTKWEWGNTIEKRKSPDYMKSTKVYVKKNQKQKWTSHASIQKRIDDLDENKRRTVIFGEKILACNPYKRLIRTYAEDLNQKCSERFERDWRRWCQNWKTREWNPTRVRRASDWNGTRVDWKMNQYPLCNVVKVKMQKMTKCACLLTTHN